MKDVEDWDPFFFEQVHELIHAPDLIHKYESPERETLAVAAFQLLSRVGCGE